MRMQARNFLLVVFFLVVRVVVESGFLVRVKSYNVVASIPCPDGVLNYITYKLAIKVGFCLR